MKTQFVCQQCGASFPTWSGQCSACDAWNSLVEEAVEKTTKTTLDLPELKPVSLAQIMNDSETLSLKRLTTTISEFDRVLGGGVVLGEVVLLAGSPGVGKSTLLTQMVLGMLTKSDQKNTRVVYVAGEESPHQIHLRIKRLSEFSKLSLPKSKTDLLEKKLANLIFVKDLQVERVVNHLKKTKLSLVVVDSVQTLVSDELSGVAGSVGQVRLVTEKLTEFAKTTNTPIFLVGHVTKEGRVAGPMTLEHMVDAVLNFFGDKNTDLRLLRATKNRFGATDEVGVFQLDETGFVSVKNPSEMFTSGHLEKKEPTGAVFSCVVEGTRPLLVEVQALVVPSHLPTPRRVGQGIDSARLQILCAVVEKYLKIPLGNYDVFVSIVGGYKTKEPALDLAVVAALVSSFKEISFGKKVFVGEVGLLGEVRKVRLYHLRQKETKRLGYEKLVSYQNLKHIKGLMINNA